MSVVGLPELRRILLSAASALSGYGGPRRPARKLPVSWPGSPALIPREGRQAELGEGHLLSRTGGAGALSGALIA